MDSEEEVMKYKSKISPKEYIPENILDYLLNKYDCEEITSSYINSIHYKFAIYSFTNSIMYTKNGSDTDMVVFYAKKNEKSKKLYAEAEEEIIVFIEKRSGYIESNSNELFYELILERGVSKFDYETESDILIDLLSHMYLYENE